VSSPAALRRPRLGAAFLLTGLVAGPVERPGMKRTGVSFGAFAKAHFLIEGQVALGFRVERDARGLGIRPRQVLDGVDQLTPYAATLYVGTDAIMPR
jgi:hypothetical protein